MQNILTHGNSLMSTVSEIAKKMWAQHLVNQERRASYYVLRAMNDTQLKDIGVSRCDIRQRVFDIHN
jgi:uncharacterized protein YjiS (DUF1127 family)